MKLSMSTFISRRIFLCLAGQVLAAPTFSGTANQVPAFLDHIHLGCSDLDRGVAFVEERTGVRAAFGGVHPGRGTQNALLSLGTRRYLEIIALDPKQSGAQQYPVITKRIEPRLIGWAAHPGDLRSFAANSRIPASPSKALLRVPAGDPTAAFCNGGLSHLRQMPPISSRSSLNGLPIQFTPQQTLLKAARFCVSKPYLPIQRHFQSKWLFLASTSPSSKVTTRNSAPLSLVRKPNSL
jgi:Glyoxalase-like domain